MLAILCVGVACLGFYALNIRSHHITRVKIDSPLRSVITPEGYDYNDVKIRAALLEDLPIGSPRKQIEEFLARHFTDVAYSIRSTSSSQLHYKPNGAHVFIPAVDVRSLAGGETVEVFLLLDSNERLKDIAVKSHRAYL